MANQVKPEERAQQKTYEGNGLTKDMNVVKETKKETEKTGYQARISPELQGYVLMASGIILLFFSLGYLPRLQPIMIGVSSLMLLWGTFRSNVITTVSNYIERMRK